jgi:AcrR family transcriptional regulator
MRATYHHGDLAGALLDAGDAVLKDQGLEGFTLRECARRAGVSHAAPKHHFGGVRGLLTALAARGFERLTARLEEQLAAAGSDLDAQFVATCRAYADFAQGYPEHFRIMFRCDLLDTEDPALATAAGATFTELTNVIRRQRGEPNRPSPQLGSSPDSTGLLEDILIGWCHVHGYAHLRLEQQLDMVPAGLEERLLETVGRRLAGLIRKEP